MWVSFYMPITNLKQNQQREEEQKTKYEMLRKALDFFFVEFMKVYDLIGISEAFIRTWQAVIRSHRFFLN